MPKLRILLVEDDGVIGLLLTMMLEDMGFEVCAAEVSEAGAVQAAAVNLPDLIITDVNLGDGSGIRAMEKISLTRATPHIFISGDVSLVRISQPYAVALQKPFQYADLERAIGRAIGAIALS